MISNLSDIRRIYVQLGLACNFRCAYCHQKQLPIARLEKRTGASTVAFIQEVADRQIQLQTQPSGRKSTLRVNLFGGEPLLYFEAIRELIQRVKRNNIQWALTTNGSLLAPEAVDFINEHRVRVFLSHDGIHTRKTRGRDVLTEPALLEQIRRIDDVRIESVLSAKNQDPYALREYINGIFERNMRIKLCFLMLFGEIDQALLDYDYDAWKVSCRKMSEAAFHQLTNPESATGAWEAQLYRSYIVRFQNFSRGQVVYGECGMQSNTMHLDLKGGVWFCNNAVGKLGTVADSCAELSKRSNLYLAAFLNANKKRCEACIWYAFCQGHCPLQSLRPQHKDQCRFMGIFFESVYFLIQKLQRYGVADAL